MLPTRIRSYATVQHGKKFDQVNNILAANLINSKYVTPKKSMRRSPVFTPGVLYINKCVSLQPLIDTYLYCDWDSRGTLPNPPVEGGLIISMKNYVIHDTIGDLDDLNIHDQLDGQLIVGKVSKRKKQNYTKKQKQTRQLLNAIPSASPNQKRGKKTNGVNSNYCFLGFRKEPLTSGKLGEYSFKTNCSDHNREIIKEGVSMLVGEMEEMGHTLIHRLKEHQHFMMTKQALNLPSIAGTSRGVATQFSSGIGYWSPIHYDVDRYVCVLSVMANKRRDNDKIIYYFCFPEYNITIPLTSGDVLVFNPLILHSCTNCRFSDGHIFSAYVSNKTVMTAGIGKFKINN